VSVASFQEAQVFQAFLRAGGTVEDLARAWASMDGHRDEFDAGKDKTVMEDETGHYAGYMVEMLEIFNRASGYARDRKAAGGK
jgi:hypothetical protein